MKLKTRGFWAIAVRVAAIADRGRRRVRAGARSGAAGAGARPAQDKPTFRVQVDLVTNDVIVRDEKGNFIPDLKKDEFEIYEDGVQAGHRVDDRGHRRPRDQPAGGRRRRRRPKGIILPPTAPRSDASGRIFLFFVDDLHLQFHNTGRVRELFKKISKELVHEGDLFGIVSSGPSSIADRHDLRQEAARRSDQEDDRQRAEADRDHQRRRRARKARAKSATARTSRSRRCNDALKNLEKVHNRRKALV